LPHDRLTADRQSRELTILNGGVIKVEPGLGQEAVEEAGPVLHPPEPVFTSAVG
jgi:hypothetical protein